MRTKFYRFGDTHFIYGKDKINFVPYTQRTGSELKYLNAIASYCKPKETTDRITKNLKALPLIPSEASIYRAIQPFTSKDLSPSRWREILK